ncbi:KipI family sensor histidine kinase inhibitor [Saccharopolyspora lacisalsi]|uniref:KipI family sensor histidine kinase inhibitor n=1 Tax=Halosaccharopolyspora lacisalsi TaxID=1000566 RepID=A0A839DYT1_9PSEU|nr:KipI family sensor histidine kinase inhibitor [Halosaccharopolyspora lacisalsi]
MRMLRCADTGLLVELDDLDAVLGLYAALAGELPAGGTDLVPAARTLLVKLDPRIADPEAVRCAVESARSRSGTLEDGGDLTVPVTYDGADLTEVARSTGLSEREVIEAHTGTVWTVAFGGFAPGFGYLAGGDSRLRVPRRDEPRTRVPAGAVGLAGNSAASTRAARRAGGN